MSVRGQRRSFRARGGIGGDRSAGGPGVRPGVHYLSAHAAGAVTDRRSKLTGLSRRGATRFSADGPGARPGVSGLSTHATGATTDARSELTGLNGRDATRFSADGPGARPGVACRIARRSTGVADGVPDGTSKVTGFTGRALIPAPDLMTRA